MAEEQPVMTGEEVVDAAKKVLSQDPLFGAANMQLPTTDGAAKKFGETPGIGDEPVNDEYITAQQNPIDPTELVDAGKTSSKMQSNGTAWLKQDFAATNQFNTTPGGSNTTEGDGVSSATPGDGTPDGPNKIGTLSPDLAAAINVAGVQNNAVGSALPATNKEATLPVSPGTPMATQ